MPSSWKIIRTLNLTLLFVLALCLHPAMAQEYSFSVPEMQLVATVQPDASLHLAYNILFANNAGASAIDVVDIGMPNAHYDISNMSATVNGVPLTDIRPSQYVKPGVEVHLDGQSIPGGESGRFHFECTIPDMVYQDTTRADYATLEITPTWFGEQYVTGNTDLSVAILLPSGVRPDELRYYKDIPYTQTGFYQKQAGALWHWPDTRLTGPHLVGLSFPKRVMAQVVRMSRFALLEKQFGENIQARQIAGIMLLALFAVLFFRFSGGTGWSVFLILGAGLVIAMIVSPAAHLILFLPVIAFLILNEWYLAHRRQHYLPPIAQVEGGGVLRGLTAPEAAVLLERPLNQVLALVLFSLLKRGILRLERQSPLAVMVTDDFQTRSISPKQQQIERDRASQETGRILYPYESLFLTVLEKHPGVPVATLDFGIPMKQLIEHTAQRAKGYDLSDTQDYYRAQIAHAWAEARTTVDARAREETLDRDFEWIYLHDDYPSAFGYGGYSYWPGWAGPSTGGATTQQPSGTWGGGTSGGGGAGRSFADWSNNTTQNVAAAIPPGSLQIEGLHGGVVDLSGSDRVTSDIIKTLSESSGGRGGGGGCACAGCACACACAGGGR